MIYDDGYALDNDNRVILCPKCKNEQFTDQVDFCRICGTSLYNYCEGYYDSYYDDVIKHKNPGNARFCETCGKPTYFFREKFLKKWEDFKEIEYPDTNSINTFDNIDYSFEDDTSF